MNSPMAIDDLCNSYTELGKIKEELTDSWYKRQIFRTETEARYGVLNDFKFPTNASKYWQAVREQAVHFDELIRLQFELRRKEVCLRQVEDKLKEARSYDRENLEIDRDELLFMIASGKEVAKDRVREIMQWSKFKNQFNDGTFDTKNPNSHQSESLFISTLNRASIASEGLSTEERLSIKGIIHGLKELPGNKKLSEKIKITHTLNKGEE